MNISLVGALQLTMVHVTQAAARVQAEVLTSGARVSVTTLTLARVTVPRVSDDQKHEMRVLP